MSFSKTVTELPACAAVFSEPVIVSGWCGVRFDELIVGEEEYPHGACEGRQEWVLMFFLGVPVPVIARWCRVDVRRVRRAVDRRIVEDPGWFDRCLLIHDQPRQGTAAERRVVRTRDQTWWEHYNDVVAYTGDRDGGRGGGLPRQNDSRQASRLYRWVEAQRRQHDQGNLTQDQVEALDGLGQWRGVRRGTQDQWWERRFGEVEQFVATTGRLPVYGPGSQGTVEGVLGIWVGTQRMRARTGRLSADRRQRLDRVLPGWM